jgi:four helix bundle protein
VRCLACERTTDVIARQLLKSATSPVAHFREALRGRSKTEYVAKMNGGLMELEETLYWLEIVEAAGLVSPAKLEAIKPETNDLIAIFVSLIKKWKGR